MAQSLLASTTEADGNQPGDPKLGVKRVVDVLRSEGMAEEGRPVEDPDRC
jgi:hypothetical protein